MNLYLDNQQLCNYEIIYYCNYYYIILLCDAIEFSLRSGVRLSFVKANFNLVDINSDVLCQIFFRFIIYIICKIMNQILSRTICGSYAFKMNLIR